jgi:hypothetical protein
MQPIYDDVMLICTNLLKVVVVIYSLKTLFLFIFWCTDLRPKALKFAKPLPRPSPLDAFGVSILGASNFGPTFKTGSPPLRPLDFYPFTKKLWGLSHAKLV